MQGARPELRRRLDGCSGRTLLRNRGLVASLFALCPFPPDFLARVTWFSCGPACVSGPEQWEIDFDGITTLTGLLPWQA